MPVTKNEFYYWDSCVFLSYIAKTPERIATLDALWEQVDKNPHQRILTSSLSIIEVAYASGDGRPKRRSFEEETAIDRLWNDPSIQLIELFPQLLYQSRSLMRNALSEGWSIKPYDAVHLATAHWASQQIGKVHELHTYDEKLFKYSPFIGNLTICEPHILQPRLPDIDIDIT